VKTLLKSVHIYQSYCKKNLAQFFLAHPVVLLAKVFDLDTPSACNSLLYNCKSAELLSTFKHSLKTELFDIAYCKREHSALSLPMCRSRHMVLYKCVLID